MIQEKVKCIECGKEFSQKGIGSHIWLNHTENGKNFKVKLSESKKLFIPWNKGLTKETSVILQKSSEKFKDGLKTGRIVSSSKGKKLSEETKSKISESRKKWFENNEVSKKIGSGKSGWYKGFWCDSSYELAYVIFNLEHGINFQRNTKSFKYEFNGKTLNYFPDFVLEDGTYIEIKGRNSYNHLDDKTKEKINQFKDSLIILYNQDMEKYLNYVKEKYSSNFVELYKDYKKLEKKIKTKIETNFYKSNNIKVESRKSLILNSDIDFTKFGWVGKVSDLIGIKPQKVNTFMIKQMPDFYKNCFVRK